MEVKQTLAQRAQIAVISCPHTIDDGEITLRFDARKNGINATGQLFQRIEGAVKGHEEPPVDVAAAILAEIARLEPNYQSQISGVDAGRRQMLEHLRKFVHRLAPPEAAADEPLGN